MDTVPLWDQLPAVRQGRVKLYMYRQAQSGLMAGLDGNVIDGSSLSKPW